MTGTGSWAVLAPAKVNLYLHVGPVRPDGRHPLDSLVVFADYRAADQIRLDPIGAVPLIVTGPFAGAAGAIEQNLALRALRCVVDMVAEAPEYGLTLDKQIPVAAGLGGGSSDAGVVLRTLAARHGIPLDALLANAAQLGGDVPVSMFGKPALMRRDGEHVETLAAFAALPALLVNPGVPCPTGPVFRHFDTLDHQTEFALIDPPEFSTRAETIHWLDRHSRNDLEAAAISMVPEIATVLDTLRSIRGVRLARMSGSGASCFALFDTDADAVAAQAEILRICPQWWCRATSLGAMA